MRYESIKSEIPNWTPTENQITLERRRKKRIERIRRIIIKAELSKISVEAKNDDAPKGNDINCNLGCLNRETTRTNDG